MAIVKMRKLNLLAMSYEKDVVLDALHRTNAVDITLHEEISDTTVPVVDFGEDATYFAEVESTLAVLSSAVESYRRERGDKTPIVKDGFDVSYSEFFSIGERKAEFDNLLAQVRTLTDERNQYKAELIKTGKEKAQAQIYAELVKPFSAYTDTARVCVRLGVIPTTAKDGLLQAVQEQELCDTEVLKTEENGVLLCVACHKSVLSQTENILSSYGFTACPYSGEKSGKEIYAEICKKETRILSEIQKNEENTYALKDGIRDLKIYCDYLAFALEKKGVAEKTRETERTFLLQAFVPAPAEKQVEEELRACSSAVYMEFSDPSETDEPPTLLKNNPIVSNFEGITDTYSTPNYRELDPNGVMAFFYSLFMGFIIGDAGYGILMLLGGGFLWWKGRKRPTGISKLAGSFAVGGIFAIIWGALFNSLFGFVVLPFTVMPSAKDDMWHILGIAVPSVLVIAMELGIVQLFAGYICKAVQEWRRGNILDGIFSGISWAIFSVGLALAIVGFVEEAKLPILWKIGGITAGVSLAIAVLTAGWKEKGFGKITKSFGSAYGVINFASDILSYARLYGLMLSGAVIATIISENCINFFASGNALLMALAVILLVVGNGFNLVMNLLGAYIHDARLQYVEFYGRFFEGEGTTFRPLGGEGKYIHIDFADKKI